MNAVGETIVALDNGHHFLHAGVLPVQGGHGVLARLDPQAHKGAEMAVQGLRLLQEPLQVLVSDHGFNMLSPVGVFVHVLLLGLADWFNI